MGFIDFFTERSQTELKCKRCGRNFSKLDEICELGPTTLNMISLSEEFFTSNALPYAICKTCGALFCHDCYHDSCHKCYICEEVTDVVRF